MKGTILTGLSTGCGKGRFSVKKIIYNETKKDSFFVRHAQYFEIIIISFQYVVN